MSGQVWAVVSRKGGVGKSMLAAAISAKWAKRGHSVVLVDMSSGMRCQDMLFGLESRIGFDLGDVLEGACGLDRALVRDRSTGVRLLAARQFNEGKPLNERTLQIILEVLSFQNDYVMLDTPGGITDEQALAARLAEKTLLVTTPDDVALRDAERAVTLLREMKRPVPNLVVNRIRADFVDAQRQYTPEVCAQLLDVPLLGVVPEDARAQAAALSREPTLGGTEASLAIDNLMARMEDGAVSLRYWRMWADQEANAAKVETLPLPEGPVRRRWLPWRRR